MVQLHLSATIIQKSAQKTKGVLIKMPRIPQVTRTMQTTKVVVLCLDIKGEKPFNKEVTLPRTYKDDKHILAEVQKIVDNDETKAVHIVSTEVVETLYGMSEQKFIENAEILPPRNIAKEDANA
jgi:hypothetical protein